MIKMDKKEQILHYYRVDGLSLREITERRETLDGKSGVSFFFVCLMFLYSLILDYFCYLNARRLFSCYIEYYV